MGRRGPGETKLQSDRRRVRARITALQADLAEVASSRQVRRRGRRRGGLPLVALVGYTNAGKSTLHRVLCASDVVAADALFATLDPTTRLLELPANRQALMTDTVGFIHDLPPSLVAAFSATLEEVSDADLLLEVVDGSHPRRHEQRSAVQRVLTDLGAADIPRILVWNKSDLAPAEAVPSAAADQPAPRPGLPEVRLSARTGAGLEELRALIALTLRDDRHEVRALLPHAAQSLLHALRQEGELVSVQYEADGVAVVARCAPGLAARVSEAALSRADTPR